MGTIHDSHHPGLTRRIWKDDYDGQMIFGDLVGLKLPDICLIGEENSQKNLTQETFPDRESNPSPLRDRRACYRLFHSGGLIAAIPSRTSFLFLFFFAVQKKVP